MASGIPKYTVEMYTDERGERQWMETWKSPLLVDGRVAGTVGYSRDIFDRMRIEEELASQEHKYRTLVENSPDMIARYGRDCRRLYVNPAFHKVVSGSTDELLGKRPSEFPGGAHTAVYEQALKTVFASGETYEFELEWKNRDGTKICSMVLMTPEFGANDQVESVLSVLRDITELHTSRQKLYQMAFHDPLTKLPNRALLLDRLHQTISDAARHGRNACLMLMDLDRFKSVNDTMGHGTGDELLCEVARRLTGCVRAYDTVAHIGGDEFIILMPEVRDGADLGRIAGKVLRTIDRPFMVREKEIFVTCSIGIAVYPHDGDNGNDLLKYADMAMSLAKNSGRNGYRFYSRKLTDSAGERLSIESGLRRAIKRNEMEVHFQPKVSLKTGKVIGSEALLRWNSAQLGSISPDRFIPIAEDTGLIVELGTWVLHQACLAACEANGDDRPEHKIAVNLSGRQFQAGNLIETVTVILGETGCRPEWIEFEITESLLLDKDGQIADALSTLQSMGLSIAVDDFGTGYSSLSYLANFSIDTLKIDKSFVQAITTDRRRAELVKAILSIAECLDQQVVAEGVETREQALFLKDNKCHFAQGWYYGKALPKAMLLNLITNLPHPEIRPLGTIE